MAIAPQKPRVLIIEDEFLIADELALIVSESGCELIGPIPTVAEAMEIVRDEIVHAVFLNFVLRDGRADSVAELLIARGIPFAFASGFKEVDEDPRWAGCLKIAKPYNPETVLQTLLRLLAK